MASGVKELFFHQLIRAAATVRPVETSCSSSADSMGRTRWPVALTNQVLSASASAAVRASVAGEILHFFMGNSFLL